MAAIQILKIKLERLRIENPCIIRGAEKELNRLENELDRILNHNYYDASHDLMSKAIERVLHCNFIINTFVSDVEVSITRGGVMQNMFLRCGVRVEGLGKFKKEIKSIRGEIREITDEMEPSKSRVFANEPPESARRGPPSLKESDVVGLEGDVEFLLNEAILKRTAANEVFIMCIVGMGGIGKTTLASILYHHPAVAAHFEIRVWITLSRDLFWEREAIRELTAVLQTTTRDEAEMIYDPDQLRNRIHQFLSGRKYFIVLDEAWTAIDDYHFFDAFPKDNSSALLITSRNQRVIMSPSCCHELKLLDAKKSWKMFSKKAFSGDGKCPKHLEEIGKQIVKKCDGLPLAIEEAAELLQREKPEPEVWEKFLESMDLKRTAASLELSYNELYSTYQPCFLSLAFFREGTTVKADKLVQLWLTGELFSYKKYAANESIGYYVLDCMIKDYSLIQVKDKPKKYNINDDLRTVDINNNVRRLAISKATEEIGLEVLTKKRSYKQPLHKCHHLVVHCSREKFNYTPDQTQRLVSLFFHGGGIVDVSPPDWKNLKVLKILDWEGFGLKILPRGVETLISLKYLGLRNNYVQELPCSLGQLKKLEVLDIAQNFLIEVPNIILKMDSLCHLHMSDVICMNPLKIHSLENLQTLTYISLDNWAYKLSGLKMMTSLRKLGIEEVDGNTDVRKLLASVVELKKLEELILKGFCFKRMPEIEEVRVGYGFKHLKLDGLLTRLPGYILSGVRRLSLVNSRLDDDPMPTLKNISFLMHLKLQNAYSGKQILFPCRQFHCLQSLTIKELWHLRSVQVEKGAMQQLETLEIISCPYLETLPKEIGKMRLLKELNMVTTRRNAMMVRKLSFISRIQKVDIQP